MEDIVFNIEDGFSDDDFNPNSNEENNVVIDNNEDLFDEGQNKEEENIDESNNKKDKEDSDDEEDISSSSELYSSLADTLVENGILSDLGELKIESPEDLIKAVEESVEKRLDDRQKRIEKALEYEVETNDIKQYENAIGYLDSITEDMIKDESEEGADIRQKLIVQDLMNRGYSQARIERELKKSIDTGNDIDDAIEALQSNKTYFQDSYNSIIEEKRLAKEANELNLQKQAKEIEKTILSTDTIFDGIKVEESIRKKAFENIYKPVYKDPESGKMLTAIQKYEKENKSDFMKNLAIIYTMTDGFKDLNKMVGQKVNTKSRAAVSRLEKAINNTARKDNGSIDFFSGVSDTEAYDGLRIDI